MMNSMTTIPTIRSLLSEAGVVEDAHKMPRRCVLCEALEVRIGQNVRAPTTDCTHIVVRVWYSRKRIAAALRTHNFDLKFHGTLQ
jgi:hypothetical protein